MTLEIRRLDMANDNHLYAVAFEWLMASPSWRQQTEAIFGTLNYQEYMTAVTDDRRCDIGIFKDGQFQALVILTLTAKYTYEVHFEASANVDPEVVVAAGHMIRDQLFGLYGAQFVYTWTPSWNRSVLAIDKAIGFIDDGVRMLHGTCRGRLVEWIRLSMKGTTDGQ